MALVMLGISHATLTPDLSFFQPYQKQLGSLEPEQQAQDRARKGKKYYISRVWGYDLTASFQIFISSITPVVMFIKLNFQLLVSAAIEASATPEEVEAALRKAERKSYNRIEADLFLECYQS